MQVEPKIAVSKKANKAKINALTIAEVDRKQAPAVPINRPNKIQEKKLKKGKIKIQKYIN